jgi:hypothetical protein
LEVIYWRAVPPDNIVRPLETITKLATAILAIWYLAGLAATSLYLSQFGISSLTFLKVQYVIVGVWMSIPPFAVVSCFSLYYSFVKHEYQYGPPPWKWKFARVLDHVHRFISAVGALLLLIFLFLLAISVLAPHVNPLFFIPGSLRALTFLLFDLIGIAVFGRATFSWLGEEHPRGAEEGSLKTFVDGVVAASLFVALAFLYVAYFATRLYPHIPSALGGGRPLSVIFVLSKDHDAQSVPLQLDPGGNRSIPYRLLVEDERNYFVLSDRDNESSLEIDRSVVLGMIVLKDQSNKSQTSTSAQ